MIVLDNTKVNIMLDLETLSAAPNAVILSVGAVYFTAKENVAAFYKPVNLSRSLLRNREVDADTLIWWMQQSAEAREVFAETRCAATLKGVLIAFQSWCRSLLFDKATEFEDIVLWGNGAAFDNVILADAYRKNGYMQPWKFHNDRCYRTVKNMFPEVKKLPGVKQFATADTPQKPSMYKHNALFDAANQAEHLQAIAEHAEKLTT